MTKATARSRAVEGWNRAIVMLARIDPVISLRAAAFMGSLAGRLNLAEPAISDVEAVAPELGADARSLQISMAASERKTRAFELISTHLREERIARLIRWNKASLEDLGSLAKGPAILVFWHLGPATALPLALSLAGIKGLLLSKEEWPEPPNGIDVIATHDAAADSFRAALERLRSGGIVAIAADAHDGAPAPAARCLGRSVQFRRGTGALARMSGAKVIPIVTTWERGRQPIAIWLRAPLAIIDGEATDLESAWAVSIAVAFEREMQCRPELLRPGKLAAIVASPRL